MELTEGATITNRRTEAEEVIAAIYLCEIRHCMLCRFESGVIIHKSTVFREYTWPQT